MRQGHTASPEDLSFRDAFEAGNVPPAQFRHRDHVRLAYIYLCEFDPVIANDRMRSALLHFLKVNNVPQGKYHETLTRSWINAVRHFMEVQEQSNSFDEFLLKGIQLLDAELMLTHYSRKVLFSEEARRQFLEPDLKPIPEHQSTEKTG